MFHKQNSFDLYVSSILWALQNVSCPFALMVRELYLTLFVEVAPCLTVRELWTLPGSQWTWGIT